MCNVTKAQVTAIHERSVTVLVLTGDYGGNLYRMPPRADVQIDQFVDIIIHSTGTRADWPETA